MKKDLISKSDWTLAALLASHERHECIDPILTGPATEVNAADIEAVPEEKPRCLFLKLPREIRLAISGLILITPGSSIKAHKLLDKFGPIDPADQPPRIRGVDSKILRTCKQVLYEAAPILYGKNTFHFSRLKHVEEFQGKERSLFETGVGSFTKTCSPPGTRRQSGRLNMLRKVQRQLDRDSSRFRWSNETEDRKKLRDDIWRDWKSFFEPGHPANLCLRNLDTDARLLQLAADWSR